MADVKFVIIGMDFLSHLGFLLDVRNQIFQVPVSHSNVKGKPSRHTPLSPTLFGPAGTLRFISIMGEFLELTRQLQVGSQMKHDVCHHIATNGPPAHAQPHSPGGNGRLFERPNLVRRSGGRFPPKQAIGPGKCGSPGVPTAGHSTMCNGGDFGHSYRCRVSTTQ